MLDDIEIELLTPKVPASVAESEVPASSGYYAIFTKNRASLPSWLANRIDSRGILYIGIASRSLATRLCRQELRHRSPATFFRGLGAALGYRPPIGSLRDKKNQRNYKFSEDDTAEIVRWIDSNLEISWVVSDSPDREIEKRLVRRHIPPMNTVHNPQSLYELADLRAECREIACRQT